MALVCGSGRAAQSKWQPKRPLDGNGRLAALYVGVRNKDSDPRPPPPSRLLDCTEGARAGSGLLSATELRPQHQASPYQVRRAVRHCDSDLRYRLVVLGQDPVLASNGLAST